MRKHAVYAERMISSTLIYNCLIDWDQRATIQEDWQEKQQDKKIDETIERSEDNMSI